MNVFIVYIKKREVTSRILTTLLLLPRWLAQICIFVWRILWQSTPGGATTNTITHCKLPLKEVMAMQCLFPFRANSHSHGPYRWLTLTLLRYWFQPPGVVHLLRALDPWSPLAQTNSQTHAQLKKAAKPPIKLIRMALGRKAIWPKCIDSPHSAW